MATRPDFPAYEAALPILGRMARLRAVAAESPARGHAHAKTGTYWVENELNGKAVMTSKALAGYLETALGRLLVLAVFVNNVMLDAPDRNAPSRKRLQKPEDCLASSARCFTPAMGKELPHRTLLRARRVMRNPAPHRGVDHRRISY